MAHIALIMGSVYGAAHDLADTINNVLTQAGHTTTFNASPLVGDIHDADATLVITSTTGQGDLPANIENFYFNAQAAMPMQHGKPFGIICLGDSSYETYCGAGEKMQALFDDLKGHAPLPMLKIDACETLEPETIALPWVNSWLNELTD